MFKRLVAELASLRNPQTLMLGVASGYANTFAFAVLCALGVYSGVLPWHWAFAALLGAKLVTNTVAWLALRADRYSLEFGGLNVAMDAIVMTGAIWATGDTASPLVAIYTIEVTVLALLTNLTCTVLVGAFAFALYVAMGLLVVHGVLPRFPTPAEWAGRDPTYLALAFAFTAFVIGVPTFYTSRILSKLREHERKLEARAHALIDAGKQKAQFMANVTHELRTPLQGIMGLSELVEDDILGPATDKQKHAMVELRGAAKRLLQLIDDLLQLTRIDAGKLELRESEVMLDDVLPSALSTAQWLLADKRLTLTLDAEPLPKLVSDRGRLMQILLNLISNAIKFTPDGGTITLRGRHRDGHIVLEVVDTGIGIAPSEQARIFDEFYQVDGSMSREYGGVGLGLTLVQRLTTQLGGTVAVDSELGRGSTFRVTLPVAR